MKLKLFFVVAILSLLEISTAFAQTDIVKKLDFLIKNNTYVENSNADKQIALEACAEPSMNEFVQKNAEKTTGESRHTINKPVTDTPLEKQPLKKQNEIKLSGQGKTEKKDWEKFVQEVCKTLPFVASALSKGCLKDITETDIIFEVSTKPGDALRIESRIKELRDISYQFFGRELSIKIIRPSAPDGEKTEKNPAQRRSEILSHPLVAEALKIFNGNIVQINSTI